jgi:hypothetical protein
MKAWSDAARKWVAVVCLPVFFVLTLACELPEAEKTCFSKEYLENTAWVKQHLSQFQRPKAGPLRVVVYTYEGQPYLAFENAFLSSPMANVFNCAGARLIELKIDYNAFKKHANEVSVLLQETY